MSTKTIYLHIGMYKTGSSTIQVFCNINAARLAALNLYYPKTGRVENTHYQVGDVLNEPPETRDALFNKLLDEIEHCGCDNVLISSESLVDYCGDRVSAKYLRQRLGEYNVKLIIYLRRQDSYLESLYNQEAKLWFMGDIESYFQDMVLANKKADVCQFDYFYLIDTLAAHFGKDNVIVKAFEPEGSPNWLWHSFFGIFNITDFDDFEVPPRGNDSLKRETVMFLEHMGDYKEAGFYNMYNDTWRNKHVSDFRSAIFYADKFIDGSKAPFLSPSRRHEVAMAYADGNAKVARKYLNQEALFQQSFPDANESWVPPGDLKVETIVQIMSALHIELIRRNSDLEQRLLSLEKQSLYSYDFIWKLKNNMVFKLIKSAGSVLTRLSRFAIREITSIYRSFKGRFKTAKL